MSTTVTATPYAALQLKAIRTSSGAARVKVLPSFADTQYVVYGWDHALDHLGNFTAAVEEYAALKGWDGNWVIALTQDGGVAVRTA